MTPTTSSMSGHRQNVHHGSTDLPEHVCELPPYVDHVLHGSRPLVPLPT